MRRRVVSAISVVLLLGAASCTSDDEPITGGDSSSPDSETPDGSDQKSPSDEPTEPESPDGGVEPATGPEVATATLKLNAPEGWQLVNANETNALARGRGLDTLNLYTVSDFGTGDRPVDQLAKEALKAGTWATPPKIVDPIEAAGVEMYHLSGQVSSSQFVDQYGAVLDDTAITIKITQATTVPAAEREQNAAAVMASAELL